jgi:hypothetical protein
MRYKMVLLLLKAELEKPVGAASAEVLESIWQGVCIRGSHDALLNPEQRRREH